MAAIIPGLQSFRGRVRNQLGIPFSAGIVRYLVGLNNCRHDLKRFRICRAKQQKQYRWLGLTISYADPVNDQATPMMILRAATWPSHQRLEKKLDVKARFFELDAYREHLQRMWGFCAALERSLTPQSFGGALPDYDTRRKLPLLTRDLAALGVSAISVPSELVYPSATPAAAFGCAYVWEGATLGGRVLLRLVEERLGLTATHGAAFLASYGDDVTAMWLKFSAALNAFCVTPDRQTTAVEAAIRTFDKLADWLCRESV